MLIGIRTPGPHDLSHVGLSTGLQMTEPLLEGTGLLWGLLGWRGEVRPPGEVELPPPGEVELLPPGEMELPPPGEVELLLTGDELEDELPPAIVAPFATAPH